MYCTDSTTWFALVCKTPPPPKKPTSSIKLNEIRSNADLGPEISRLSENRLSGLTSGERGTLVTGTGQNDMNSSGKVSRKNSLVEIRQKDSSAASARMMTLSSRSDQCHCHQILSIGPSRNASFHCSVRAASVAVYPPCPPLISGIECSLYRMCWGCVAGPLASCSYSLPLLQGVRHSRCWQLPPMASACQTTERWWRELAGRRCLGCCRP